MKKTTYLMIVMSVFVVLFASACGGAATPAASGQTFAPACQAATSCAAPAVIDTVASDRYCVDKVPYQNILIDDGVAFEVFEPDKLTCVDNGTKVDGKHVVECHGTENWASKVKFTNTACGGAGLQTGTGQCQEGLGYDAAQNCCAPLTAGDAGSVTITVNMGECKY